MEIEATDHPVQTLAPPDSSYKFEGLAFSPSGSTLAVTAPDTNTVFMFRRRPDGLFEDAPGSRIDGPASDLNYPHDLSFGLSGETELLAVAHRTGAVCVYQKNKTTDDYGTDPVFEIRGWKTRLRYCEGVAFVPQTDGYLAACSLTISAITFYRSSPGLPVSYELKPVLRLNHRSLYRPDGLGFSKCGTWLAVANHGNHTVSIYERRNIVTGGGIQYGPKPVSIIRDPSFRHPHSVAFTPKTNHVVVTNAGANYFNVYRPERQGPEMRWSQTPVLQRMFSPDDVFRQINTGNKMEGGPKGVAIHDNTLAVSSPACGIKIYSLREGNLETGPDCWIK